MWFIRNILIWAFSFCLIFANAQVKFYASGSQNTSVGTNYKISFILENASGSEFRPPSFEGFNIVAGPEQGSSYSWVNGKTSQSISISYYLKAKEEGELVIEPATIKVEGKTLSTKEIKVSVGPNAAMNKAQSNEKSENKSWKEQVGKDVFVKLYTDNTKPYVGEQIFVYAKLYQSINIYNLQGTKYPDFNGFWRQEVKLEENSELEIINGKQYMSQIIAKNALFPQREGTFTIKPYEYYSVVLVQEPMVQNFGGFQFQTYGQKQVEYEFKSNSLNIEVQALPEQDKPLSFYGAVGNFQMEQYIDSSEIALGSPINLYTKISGTGNVMMIDEPIVEFPKNFDVFDPVVDENISKKSNYINGSLNYKHLIIPQRPGSFVIPGYEFSYFDLKSDTYKTLVTPDQNIRVKGELPAQTETPESKETELIFSNELKPIHRQFDFSSSDKFYGSTGYYIAIGAPLFLLCFLFLGLKFKENIKVDVVALKNKRASKEATKRLKKAKFFLDKQDKKSFYTEVFDALNGYVSDKFNISQAELNKDLILKKFSENEISVNLSDEFTQVITNSEAALYSPATASKMQEDYDIAIKWIVDIENEIS